MSPGLFTKLRKIQFAFSSCVSCDEKHIRTYVPANRTRLVHIAHRLRLETRERERARKRIRLAFVVDRLHFTCKFWHSSECGSLSLDVDAASSADGPIVPL